MRFLRKLLGETDAIEEAKREAGDDLEGGVQAPEAATLPEEPDETEPPERSSPGG
jgi:hypothetical protein